MVADRIEGHRSQSARQVPDASPDPADLAKAVRLGHGSVD
jgi:hypothetical protein